VRWAAIGIVLALEAAALLFRVPVFPVGTTLALQWRSGTGHRAERIALFAVALGSLSLRCGPASGVAVALALPALYHPRFPRSMPALAALLWGLWSLTAPAFAPSPIEFLLAAVHVRLGLPEGLAWGMARAAIVALAVGPAAVLLRLHRRWIPAAAVAASACASEEDLGPIPLPETTGEEIRWFDSGSQADLPLDPHLGDAQGECLTCHAAVLEQREPDRSKMTVHQIHLDELKLALPCTLCHATDLDPALRLTGSAQTGYACSTCHLHAENGASRLRWERNYARE
jgi:ferredoxin